MPAVSRWCIRAALVYLLAGMSVGAWALTETALDVAPGGPWRAVHTHLLLVGFLILMVMGVAHWMFPRRDGRRVGRAATWVAFALVNAGLLLRVASEVAIDQGGGRTWNHLLAAAAWMPVAGILAFAVGAWPRVKAAMSKEETRRLREEARLRAGGSPPG
ncbi:MAG: hypothetical protein AB1416_08150 [Actinomycetota bacterium]